VDPFRRKSFASIFGAMRDASKWDKRLDARPPHGFGRRLSSDLWRLAPGRERTRLLWRLSARSNFEATSARLQLAPSPAEAAPAIA
jgi:hypothetical protein